MGDTDRYPGLKGNVVASVLFVAAVVAFWGLGKFDAVAAITALIGFGLAWAAYVIIAKRRNPGDPKYRAVELSEAAAAVDAPHYDQTMG